MSLLNNHRLHDYSLLLVSEPHYFTIDGKVEVTLTHYWYWLPILFTITVEERWLLQAMIWVHRNIHVNPVLIDSLDLAAATIKINDRLLLIISVYILRIIGFRWESKDALNQWLSLIH